MYHCICWTVGNGGLISPQFLLGDAQPLAAHLELRGKFLKMSMPNPCLLESESLGLGTESRFY